MFVGKSVTVSEKKVLILRKVSFSIIIKVLILEYQYNGRLTRKPDTTQSQKEISGPDFLISALGRIGIVFWLDYIQSELSVVVNLIWIIAIENK